MPLGSFSQCIISESTQYPFIPSRVMVTFSSWLRWFLSSFPLQSYDNYLVLVKKYLSHGQRSLVEGGGARGPLSAPSSAPRPSLGVPRAGGAQSAPGTLVPRAPPSVCGSTWRPAGESQLPPCGRRWPPSQRPHPRRWLCLPPACSGLLRAKGGHGGQSGPRALGCL